MPLKLAIGVREAVTRHRLGALEGNGVYLAPSNASFRGMCLVVCQREGGVLEIRGGWVSKPPPPLPWGCSFNGDALSAVQLFGRVAVVETHTLWYFGHHCCLVEQVLMHWGYGIFGCSPYFTHFYLFAHIFYPFPPHLLFFSVD